MIPRKVTANLFAPACVGKGLPTYDGGRLPTYGAAMRRAAFLCRRAIRFIAVLLALSVTAAAWAAGEPVAEVSLAIGVSRLIGADGNARAIVRGMSVHVGERVETEQGGHVHLRFIDGAFVSVRPGSRLAIETYRYDAARPQDSAIRFTLEQGVARAISGKGAEAARDHFRLNTPIAAIGVRGTDFVVLAGPEWVRVAINSGAIVLTPLGEGCLAVTLGPCTGAGTSTLSADMGKVVLDFQRQVGAPRLVPINGTLAPDRLNPPVPEEPRSVVRNSTTVSETSIEVLAAQAVAAAQGQVIDPQPPAPAVVPPPAGVPPPSPPPPAVVPPTLPPATVVWGRWTAPLPGDTLSASYAEASAGRKVTAGNLYFALFRPEPPLPVLVSNLGRVDFTLRDAQVWLMRGGSADLGRVEGAWLSVDFGARQFGTRVDMSHAAAGAASLQLGGAIRDDGVFAVRPGDGRAVAGALTVDGKEAGYFFEQPVTTGAGGTFMGITRWVR